MTERGVFSRIGFIGVNILAAVYSTIFSSSHPDLSLVIVIPVCLIGFAVANLVMFLHWPTHRHKPVPLLAGRMLWRKVIFGNLVGLGVIGGLYARGLSESDLDFLVAMFVVGNIVFVAGCFWQRSYRRKLQQRNVPP